ncbi:MAG TPA: carbohydrate ABC transporter permease [Thermotogota bacterium]|nr:carbohydrate ABC transporter permease [Thermotogota bacterium]HPJ87788.1 carbohydrate ABC transporter permease [Thermotogota bacterium]HPR95214.1 carbohydrate ABC transporter permease [Thermotogota bacterium]
MKGRRFIYKRVLYYVIISLLALFALIPFFWMLSTSLKETNALTTIPIQWLPEKVSFSAYTELFTVFPFTRSILNSLFISVVGTFISVMSSAMAAYVFGKIEFKGREVLFTFYLATMMIPGNLLMIPNYLTLRSMGLLDSLVGVLLPSFFNAFGTFLLRQNIKSLPNSFIEAAVIDGASRIKVFFKIILPLVKPAVTTVTVLTFMGNWNAYLWPLIVLTSKENMTLTVGLSLLNGQYGTDYNLLMAGAIISIIPMIVVYAFSQKHIEVGFNVGSLK